MNLFIKAGYPESLDPLSPSGIQLICNKIWGSVKLQNVCAILSFYIYSIYIVVSF